MSSKLWQQPYVNIFKHFQISEWKKCSKEGDVSTLMDKTLKCTVYRISGSVPAGNYIQFPKTSSQSLGLTGHYIYMLFKPIVTKYFVVHIDAATDDGIIIRISFSNLFKEFKSTSTWLQFPFVSNPAPGSVEEATAAVLPLKSKVGTAPKSSRWTLLCMDLHYMLSVYLNRKYAYVKTIRLCANMLIKNIFTSDTKYTPGISMKVARKTGLLDTGFIPLPREMSFSAEDLAEWQRKYDYVTFPAESGGKTVHDVIPGKARSPKQSSRLATLSPVKFDESEHLPGVEKERRTYSPKQYTRNPVKSRVTMIDRLLEDQSSKKKVYTGQLPEVGLNEQNEGSLDNESIHIYPSRKDRLASHKEFQRAEERNKKTVHNLDKKPKTLEFNQNSSINCLQPDPILALEKLIGVGGGTMKILLWTKLSSHIVYPCHAVIVSMDARTGKQSFLLGHNNKITALAFNGNSTMLASAQLGEDAVIRIWKYKNKKCLAVFQSHMNDPYCLSFSQSGNKLCAVGHDNHGKQVVAVWDASFIMNGHRVTMIAKAHLDVKVAKIKICPFDDFRLVSCGKSNIRFWKLKDGSLRSRPIDLGEYHSHEFTDFDFECIQRLVQDASDRQLYSCSKSGAIFVINLKSLSIVKVYRLLTDRASFTCLSVNDAFCVTGSSDGYVRLWPLDFDGPFMEAEHEGVISAAAISSDGILVSAITETGNLGVLDLSTKSYKTLIRSHLKRITSISFDDIRNQIATVSDDRGIKIWSQGNMTQLYDFNAPDDVPCVAAFHPTKEILVCGFENGIIRIFDIASTSLIAELTNHKGKITGLLISPDGNYLNICDSKGSLALYDSSQSYGLVRLLPNALARLQDVSFNSIVIDDKGRRLACIGPSEFVINVFDARSLDEILHIDITSMAHSKSDRKVDAGHLLCYTPSSVGHLVVVTSSSKMLKLEASSGQLISEVANIHRGKVTAICVSPTGQYLATAGDKVIKIWDYHMKMDLNFQVFIGHSEPITNLKFTADCSQFYSAGECLFIWAFLGKGQRRDLKSLAHKSPKRMIDFSQQKKEEQGEFLSDVEPNAVTYEDEVTYPRGTVPQPLEYEPINATMSPTPQSVPKKKIESCLDISSESSSEDDLGAKPIQATPESKTKRRVMVTDAEAMPTATATATAESLVYHHAPPTVMAHFKIREKVSRLAEKRYSAPNDQAGLKLKSVVGYDGRGRNNIIWHPITGLFVYACGCIVVIEDLTSGRQKLLRYHMEDISSLASQNDGQVVASASVAGPSSVKSQICIWEIRTGLCRKVINHHKYVILAMQYSRDDRFLVTIGDYRECSVAIWSTIDYSLLVTSFTRYPIHCVKWDPYTMNEFATVGQNGTVLFWLLDETKQQITLNVHEAEVPDDIFTDKHETTFDLTSLVYAGNSVMYVGASNGVVSAWDTRQNKCFMHWKSDNSEILQMVAGDGKLITGGVSQNLCLWSVAGVSHMRSAEDHENALRGQNGLIMDDELHLDGCIVSAIFDSNLDIGVVGTSSGTIWYINWDERTSIRLISGHKDQVNALIFGGNNELFMASCASDGSVRLWNTDSYEQTLQFLVLNQRCNCISFRPLPQSSSLHTFTQDGRHETTIHSPAAKTSRPSQCVAGYSDGTVRMFDLGLVEMILKLHPHPVSVTAIAFSSDGRVIISGAEDGLIAISSPTTGMTIRMLTDHKGAPITDIHVSLHKDHSYSLSSPTLWLAASADRRVSIWTADWSKDFCELVDWLSFPAPNFAPDGTIAKKSDKDYYKHFPPSLARFSPVDSDMIIYTGYGMKKQLMYYSLSRKKVVKAVSLTDWALAIDISPAGDLIAIGSKDRLVKIVDYHEGTFQDFIAHSDAVRVIKFSPNASVLFSAGFTDVIVWQLSI